MDADEREGNKNYSRQGGNRYQEDDTEIRHDTRSHVSGEEERNINTNMSRMRIGNQQELENRSKNQLNEAKNTINNSQMRREMPQDQYYESSRMMPNYSTPPQEAFETNNLPYDQLRYNGGYEQSYDDDAMYQINGSQGPNNNNMMIMQYESVLQSVNKEFQKLLNKNRETEEELNITEMKLKQTERIIEDLKQQSMSEKINEDKRFNLAQIERHEFENEMGLLREQINRKNEEIDRLNTKVMELEHQTSTTGILRQKIDELMNKNQQKDVTTREKEEHMFNLSREVESLRSDLRNMEHIENTLKSEIEELLDKRRNLEDINQNLKNQI